MFSVITYIKDQRWVLVLPGALIYLAISLCFIIGGIGLCFIKNWARYFVLIILGVDVLTVRWIEFIYIWSNFRAVQPPKVRFGIDQSLILINIAIEIVVFWYLCRRTTGKIFLPQKDELRESEMVHLMTIPNDIEAVLIYDLLKQVGIKASSRSGVLSGLINISTDGISNYWWNEIMVLDKDYDTAKEIVDEYLKTFDNKNTEEKLKRCSTSN